MIIGFSKHGTGSAKLAMDYLTDREREGREENPPEVIRGYPEHTQKLADSLDFKNKYTSGVLSFAPDEKITPETETKIMDQFESMAFAGLEKKDYDITWVRHTHAGHHEMHFVTPRVELSTGKSFNIKPPGEKTQNQFDDLRSQINATYGLADPDDPSRKREISRPNHDLKVEAEALRASSTQKKDLRNTVHALIKQGIVTGQISSREDILKTIHGLGFETPRAGKDYITIKHPDFKDRYRLKGEIYGKSFRPDQRFRENLAREKSEDSLNPTSQRRGIDKKSSTPARDYSKPDPEAAREFQQRVAKHTQDRASYNAEYYQKNTQDKDLECNHNPDPDRDINLSGYISRLRSNHQRPRKGNPRTVSVAKSNQSSNRKQNEVSHANRDGKRALERCKQLAKELREALFRDSGEQLRLNPRNRAAQQANQSAQRAIKQTERSTQQIQEINQRSRSIKLNRDRSRGNSL